MPEKIKQLPKDFFDNIDKMSFQEIAYTVANAFFGEDVEVPVLWRVSCSISSVRKTERGR